MAIDRNSSLTDVCFAVCTALDDAGTTAVLSGGSAATYYAPRAYQSRDADFIIVMSLDGEVAASALDSLGYEQIGGTYAHRENRYTLEFPPGPLAVGGDRIIAYETVRRNSEILHIISATDCVRDRLASFFFYGDRSALSAAVAVAQENTVDLQTVEDWSSRERAMTEFREFRALLG